MPLPEAAHIYARDGRLLAEVAGPRRRALPSDRIPDLVKRSFVAIEDRRFWDHGGVDARGVLRAALTDLRHGGISEGASTIPMQLVRTLWAERLRGVGPWRRKVIEARTAPRLVEDLGHDRVLTLYLNSIYLGNGLYGVEAAARRYFGVGVGQLDLGQVATLVGITRSPEFYEPEGHPDRARAVRNVVLSALAEAGVVSGDAASEASSSGLELGPVDSTAVDRYRRTHLTAAVLREVARVAPALAERPGLNVYTTIDEDVQTAGVAALETQLSSIESGRYGPFEASDSTNRLEGAGLALDPSTGSVLAWIGGRDFSRSEFDRVAQARRQVGSLIKPFLVATALDRGYGIVDLVSADTVPIVIGDSTWLPDDHVTDTLLPLREALVHSSNRAAAHLGASLGLESVRSVMMSAGLTGPIPLVPSTALGTFDASLLEMTGAYAMIGNAGVRAPIHMVERIEDSNHAVLWTRSPAPSKDRVLDERTAFVVLDALRAVVDRGTAYGVRQAGYRGPAAGKTGTTNDNRDAWFIGMTPDVVAGVWIGFDQPREIVPHMGGGQLAAPVWGSWMRRLEAASDGWGSRAWIPPPGVEPVRYDPETGEVLSHECGGRFGVDYREAWVIAGRYRVRDCRRGPLGWLQRLWHTVVPGSGPRAGRIPMREGNEP